MSKEYHLVSYDLKATIPKIYIVTIEGNKFKKKKKKAMHFKYYDYKVFPNFKYKIENFKSGKFSKEFRWDFEEHPFRIRLYEVKKKKHLFLYAGAFTDCQFIVNHLIMFLNNGDSHRNR